MPKIYYYDPEQGVPEFPSRNTLLSASKEVNPDDEDRILFHGFDMQNINKYKVYNRRVEGYSVIITGILENGERANLIIDQIPIYFDIRISKENTLYEKREIVKTIKSVVSNEHENWEMIERYPGVGFSQNEVFYMRYYFDNQWDRKKALKAIRSSKNKYETASDVDGNLLQTIQIEYEWTFGDWSLIQNYDCEYDGEKQIHNIFISDPKDYVAVSRPLSAEPPTYEVPQMPIYFHIPYDIEVNGMSDALPSVSNRDEKIFMLSGGIYRSDKPKEPMVSFTISHMKCMEDKYEEYMSSQKRKEFMEDDRPDWVLILTESEEDTLLAFADVLGKIQPEFKSQFNGYSFDDPFIVTRIHQYGKLKKFVKKLSIVPYYYTNFNSDEKDKNGNEMFKRILLETHIKLEAGVFDNNDNRKRLNYLGSINIDVMCAMKRLNTKDELLEGHALRAYLSRYGLPKKIDMSIYDMNEYYRNEDGLGMLLSADYCTVDSLSCHRILSKVALIQQYLATSHLALCTLNDSVVRAGGMKVKNVIYCFGKRLGLNYSEYTIPERIDGKYPGAVVFAPVRGRYTEVPTIALDFASLYPSIMRAVWTSAETYIDADKKPKLVERLKNEGYDIFDFNPKWKYESEEEGTKEINRNVAFVRKHPDGTECRGVYPKSLEFLTNIRKMYKNKMAEAMNNVARLEKMEETGDVAQELFEARLKEVDFNQKQLAVKIISNTIYGKIGSKTFNLHNPFIASTITLMGQKLITAASDVSTEKGYKRLYGDSFTGNTPVIIREDNQIRITRVDELIQEDKWQTRIDGKEYYDFEKSEIWEQNRFVKANQIIRHKTDKEIVRVKTNCGLVDVTRDHSLYNSKGEKISPDDIIVTSGNKWADHKCISKGNQVLGTELLTTKFDNLITEIPSKDYGITEDLAWCYGAFLADGYCEFVCNGDRVKNAKWQITNSSKNLLERLQAYLPFKTKIYTRKRVEEGKYIYDLELNGNGYNCKPKIVTKWRSMFYNNSKDKKIPIEILHSSKEMCKSFLDGLCSFDSDKIITFNHISQRGQELCLGLIVLILKCDYDRFSLNDNHKYMNHFRIGWNFSKNTMKEPNVVKDKYTLHKSYNDFVYDFNTETGKHHAGIGNLVVSNTDSVFLKPGVEMMRGTEIPAEKVKICQDLAEEDLLPDILKEIRRITRRETNVVSMELDKLLYPCLMVGKKKYCGVIYEGTKKPHEYISGLEFIKRGKSRLVVDLSKAIVKQVLDLDCKKEVIDMVLEVFKDSIDKIDQQSLDYFVKTAKYRTGKEGFLTLFIGRMKQCALYDPVLYEIPKPGVVFEYLITNQEYSILHNGNQRKLKTSDKMEFKSVVEQSAFMKPDYMSYLEDAIGPLTRFICFHDEFNENIDNTDEEVIDKKSNDNAKKYLTNVLKEYMGIKKIKHTIVKRQLKKINAEHSKQYEDLIYVLQQAFDKDIRTENICQFIINVCKEVPVINGVQEENIEEKIEKNTEYINNRQGKLTGIYSRYLKDINLASKEEVDINVFKKSSKISSSTKEICKCIEELKYLNGLVHAFGISKTSTNDYIMALLLEVL